MKKQLLLIFSTLSLSMLSQTFPIGHMSINFKDISRTGGYAISGGITTNTASGRDIGTEVYYPATITGNNQPVAAGQFPVVVIGHGFVMSWDSYDNIYNQLAAKGYIVLLPRTEGGFSPTHAEFGEDLKYLANAGMNLNTVSTPSVLLTFNGKVAQKSAIGGHSMGAGSSYLASAGNTSITCLFNFAAATTNPSSISSASLVTVPTLVISGARDCVADTTVQNGHYNALASSKKFHVILKQLTHCDFGNGTNGNCTLGQGTSGCGNQVSNTLAFPRYMNYLQNFLDNQLKNDCPAGQRFMDSVNTTSTLRAGLKKLGSIICLSTGIKESQNAFYSVFPNPTQNTVNINFNNESLSNLKLEIITTTGQIVYNSTINERSKEITLNIETLDSGIYFLVVYDHEKKHIQKLVKH